MSLDISHYPLLAQANTPDELRKLPQERLAPLCEELRRYLLRSVSRSSGHLASGLGVVELTVALHYVYQTPFDRLVWDVGQQAYQHKIATGRRERMQSIRQKDGLHLGPAPALALAAKREGEPRKAVAIIGEGALTAGMAFEALNHAGDLREDLLVILNDNEMSISENVGALNNHLARWLSGQLYTTIREGGKKVLSGLPPVKELARRAEEHLKGMVIPGTLFEEFGFNYIGPIDGHDVNALISTLRNMRQLKGPQLLHVMTKTGKGYEPAEQDPIGYHGVPKFNPDDDCLPQPKGGKPSFSAIFGQWLCDMAAQDERLIGITPAMREGSGMVEFSQQYPQRYFDVAIAEQHAVTLAAGMAIGGLRPVVAIYSSFLQRAYDQLIHDVALQNLPVLFAIDRAGIVGADGPTHQGAFDISFLRTIPNMTIMTPSDEDECRQMLCTGYQLGSPASARYPRGIGSGITPTAQMQSLTIGKGRLLRQGKSVAILAFGTLLQQAKPVAEQLGATLADMRFVKPLDEALLGELAASHDYLVTLEDGALLGGAGSAVNEALQRLRLYRPVLNLGLPDRFIEQGTQEEIYQLLGLDSAGIEQSIREFITAPSV